MCWIGKTTDKKVAEKDIVVYKVLRQKEDDKSILYAPYFQSFKYELGREYHMDKKINHSPHYTIMDISSISDIVSINQGFHCYNGKCKCCCRHDRHIDVASKSDTGLIAYFRDMCRYKLVISKGLIKKGTEYYENEYGEIVAESLLIEKLVELPEKEYRLFKELS